MPDLALADPADRGVRAEALIDAARRAESAARAVDPRIENSEGSSASASFARVAYANSAGFAGDYAAASHSLFAEPIARANGGMQRDYWMSAARSLAALESPEAVGRRAAERALRRLGARTVATCEVPVIFDPLTAASLWGQVAGLVSGYAVYRGTTYLAGKLGEAVASEAVTLVDDACRPGGLGSRPFDGEGLPSRRTAVIERGRLASYLLDTYSARKVGGRSTGSASRSASSAPGVGATNLGLAPGTASLEEIIADTPRGSARDRADRHGLQPDDGRLLARRRGPLDRGRRDRLSRRGGHDRGELRRHAARDRRGRQRSALAVADRIAERARRAHDGGRRTMSGAPAVLLGTKLPDVDVWSPRVTVALGQNPSLFTGPGTNTYLVGTGRERILLDTGQGMPAYLPVLASALERAGCRIQEIVLTHGHPDHIGGAADVIERHGPLRVSKRPHAGFDAPLPGRDHADRRRRRRAHARARRCARSTRPATPRTTSASRSRKSSAIFSGDNVLGVGTTVIPAEGGDLLDYMHSLERLLAETAHARSIRRTGR